MEEGPVSRVCISMILMWHLIRIKVENLKLILVATVVGPDHDVLLESVGLKLFTILERDSGIKKSNKLIA